MDGDWPQIKAVTLEEIMKLSDLHRHSDCKHAAAASLVQQPCDVGMIFKSQHSLQARTTEKDECSILAKNINQILANHAGLHLSDQKRRALSDGISCQPKNHQRVCTPDNTRNSFIGAGLLDEGSKSAPDMLAILKT
jgi:bifunctional N-acetylglucosamine-1-phosphate-uridyltransferase/glucosamine-1-phosphate-acetyltransferase GlmU-like protein